MDTQIDAVVLKVSTNLVTIQIGDIEVHDGETAAPGGVAVRQLLVVRVEDTIQECEVILDLLIARDGEACLGRLDRG